MDALISFTNKTSSNLSDELKRKETSVNMNKIKLLKQKLEDSIENNTAFVVYISSPSFECRNTIWLDDFEVNENYLYLSDGNYEVHINIDDASLKYDDTFDINFIFIMENVEIGFIFRD